MMTNGEETIPLPYKSYGKESVLIKIGLWSSKAVRPASRTLLIAVAFTLFIFWQSGAEKDSLPSKPPIAVAQPAQQPAGTLASLLPQKWVLVKADGIERELLTSQPTVADLLKEMKIALGPLDRVSPSPSSYLAHDSIVVVVRVTVEEEKQQVSIPCETQARFDPRVRSGRPIVLQSGQPGLAEQWIRIWRKDGVETCRQVTKTLVLRKPADKVVLRGSRSLSSRGLTARKVLVMTATGYHPGPQSCGKYATGWTAIGLRAGKGVVAVDPRIIPLGTRLYIEGYGFAIAGDVGGAIKGHRIDLGYDTYSEAKAVGRRKVKVHILD